MTSHKFSTFLDPLLPCHCPIHPTYQYYRHILDNSPVMREVIYGWSPGTWIIDLRRWSMSFWFQNDRRGKFWGLSIPKLKADIFSRQFHVFLVICWNMINTECREVKPALYLMFCEMVRRWDPCSSFGIAYFSGPSGLLRHLETWPRRWLWWLIKRPYRSPEMLWVLARIFAWYQTSHLVQARLRHWLGWI